MLRLNGSHLEHIIQQKLEESSLGLTIKQLAESIHIYDDKREMKNFKQRIWTQLNNLIDQGLARREPIQKSNLFAYKYFLIDVSKEKTGHDHGTARSHAR